MVKEINIEFSRRGTKGKTGEPFLATSSFNAQMQKDETQRFLFLKLCMCAHMFMGLHKAVYKPQYAREGQRSTLGVGYCLRQGLFL